MLPKIWITSDLHLGHNNILRYCCRPFETIEDHDDVLIKNINDRMGKNDVLVVLGDFAFTKSPEKMLEYIDRIVPNIWLVAGNHDDFLLKVLETFTHTRVNTLYKHGGVVNFVGGRKVFLNHYPMLSWRDSCKGRVHLFGHVHSSPKRPFRCQKNSYDVGVDNNDYLPLQLNDAIQKAKESESDMTIPIEELLQELRMLGCRVHITQSQTSVHIRCLRNELRAINVYYTDVEDARWSALRLNKAVKDILEDVKRDIEKKTQ